MAQPRCPTATWTPLSRMTTAPSSPSRPRTCRAIWQTNTTRTPTPARPAPTAGCRIRSAASFRPALPRQGRQLEQLERLEYRQRRFWRQLGRKILRVSILTTAAAFFVKAAAGLLSEFFVITLRNVLLFRGAATTKKLLQRLIRAAGVFLLFPFQPEHLKLPVSVGLVLVEFLGLDVALEGTVKLQGVPVLLNVGQHAGNGGFLALKLRFAVP